MPAVIPVHIALRSRLKDSACKAATVNNDLEVVIAVKPSGGSSGFHGKVDHSQPPWHAPVANAIMDLHALAREMEAWLRLSQGLPRRPRGGSSENTVRALNAVVRLSEGAADGTVRGHTRDLESWIRRARVALCEVEMPKQLPRAPGAGDPKCPFCGCHTLRMVPLAGEVFCINPGCPGDEDGRKPRAHLEFSVHVGDWVLVWQDGIAGVPA